MPPAVSTKSNTDEEKALRGVTKAAIVLMSVESSAAASVLRLLPAEVLEDVTREIAQLDLVDAKTRGKVIEEFYTIALAQHYMEKGGVSYAKALLDKALPTREATRIFQLIQQQVYKQPFAFLAKTDGENLLAFIQDEHPQTIALVLSHLQATKSAEIVAELPLAKQVEVVTRIANMDNTNPEVIKEVERGLEARLAGITSQQLQRVGGVEAVAEMLNNADRSTEKAILESLEAEDPELVDQIRRLMFVFEDIVLVNGKGIQAILKEIENDDLSLALKTASEDLRDKIFRNMSERAVQLIKEDMEYMGPVRVSDVESAQQKIVDVARRLEESGEIIVSGRGGEDGLIV